MVPNESIVMTVFLVEKVNQLQFRRDFLQNYSTSLEKCHRSQGFLIV